MHVHRKCRWELSYDVIRATKQGLITRTRLGMVHNNTNHAPSSPCPCPGTPRTWSRTCGRMPHPVHRLLPLLLLLGGGLLRLQGRCKSMTHRFCQRRSLLSKAGPHAARAQDCQRNERYNYKQPHIPAQEVATVHIGLLLLRTPWEMGRRGL
jgi:hypothetical protein